MSTEPRDLLVHARALLDGEGASSIRPWPRACALLTRQALEELLACHWAQLGWSGLTDASARSQFICLATLEDTPLTGSVTVTWVELSNACHLHAYELAPTADELLRWIEVVELFAAQVTGPPPTQS